MTVTYTIQALERPTGNDGIITAHWSAINSEVVEGVTHTGSLYGFCNIAPEEGDTLIPYADITEAIAIGWVKEKMGEEAVTTLEESIAAQIEESKSPAIVSGLPWPTAASALGE